MWLAGGWTDYELLDAGYGEKLERWGSYILRRPDPQALWPADKESAQWRAADAVYRRSASGGGHWDFIGRLPDSWEIGYRGLRFKIRLMPFKHTGIFPEQAVNWDWLAAKLGARAAGESAVGRGVGGESAVGKGVGGESAVGRRMNGESAVCRSTGGENAASKGTGGEIALSIGTGGENAGGVRATRVTRVLNLFAYTGASTAAAASAGAFVCHVDAARGIVSQAKENVALSCTSNNNARYIIDDVLKFVSREKRRGSRYDAVIMDPPAYGRGPGGELWKAETHLCDAVELCADLLADEPLFFIVSTYAAGVSPTSVENILKAAIGSRRGGHTESAELGLPVKRGNMALPCGCSARWERD